MHADNNEHIWQVNPRTNHGKLKIMITKLKTGVVKRNPWNVCFAQFVLLSGRTLTGWFQLQVVMAHALQTTMPNPVLSKEESVLPYFVYLKFLIRYVAYSSFHVHVCNLFQRMWAVVRFTSMALHLLLLSLLGPPALLPDVSPQQAIAQNNQREYCQVVLLRSNG